MSKNIFVGNLAWGATEDDLRNAFSQFGEVLSAKVITDRETGRSRGFGFVEMNDAEAEEAIQALDGATIMNRPIKVNEARPRPERPPRRW